MTGVTRTLYAVGKVVKPFGVRGEVVVQPLTETTERYRALRTVFVGSDEATAQERRIESTVVQKRHARVKLEGVHDRNTAETLRGCLLFVDERDRIEPGEGAYFIHDIVGLTVLDHDGEVLGYVKEVLKLPAQDVYVVAADNREVLVPAVKEFILEVNLNDKTMRVKIIEGMME